MEINSKEEAFKAIETLKNGIPFEAIKYLVNFGKDKEILNKVIYHIENAYNDLEFYDEKANYYSNAPLWYSIVAEGQVDSKLVNPIIKLYTTTREDNDFLNEQGVYVLGKLCAELGDEVIEKCVEKCLELNKEESELPYLFLFESFDFSEGGKYDNEILELLSNPEGKWIEGLIGHLGKPRYAKILPRLKELEEYYVNMKNRTLLQNHTIIEIRGAIKRIENENKEVEDYGNVYYKSREGWESHYKKLADRFERVKPKKLVNKKRKIGRNEQCPCGSGKKYKKCCLI